MSNTPRVLLSHTDAAWLPAGGRADVVVAGEDAIVPSPTCLVRLLVTRGREVLTVARGDGRGPDIPTLAVGDITAEECRDELLIRIVGSLRPSTLLGYVRNRVNEAPADYPWPAPDAYFVVWHCPLPPDRPVGGEWLGGADAGALLRDRHWWPLAAPLVEKGP